MKKFWNLLNYCKINIMVDTTKYNEQKNKVETKTLTHEEIQKIKSLNADKNKALEEKKIIKK
jgi:hypothetical protein